jgi:signal transduction histidine kinase
VSKIEHKVIDSDKKDAPTVLVVEDESIVAMDMERRLRGLGYIVAGRVLTGKDAILEDEHLKPDVILMDIHLKGEMDGIEAAGIIRSRRSVPVIYITAYSDQATLERAKQTQPHGYILKPFQEREIHSVIEMALYKHRSEAELLKAKLEAEEGLRARNEFLSKMSHEFRTPLNSILGMASLACEHIACGEVKEYLELVIESGKTLLDMVNSVLDYSRIDSNHLGTELSVFDIPLAVERLVARFSHQAARRKIFFTISVSEDIPHGLFCDGEKYFQIIQNLVSNALKFTESGSVLLSITASEPVTENSGQMLITVTDTGIGIKPGQEADIFEAFTQADGSATRTFGGTGLGLAIVHSFVDQCGGSIAYKSEEGTGTSFEVKLPVRTGSEQPIKSEEIRMVMNPEQGRCAHAASVSEFIDFCERILPSNEFGQIEHAAEVIRNQVIRSGNGNMADNILRVVLGARKNSVEKVEAALELLKNEKEREAEEG